MPLAYVLGRALGYGPPGVFWAMAIAFSLMSVVSAVLFRRGTWKEIRVEQTERTETTGTTEEQSNGDSTPSRA